MGIACGEVSQRAKFFKGYLMMRRVAVATAIGLLLAGQAMAAEVRMGAVSGSVMVNQNGKFAPASRGAVLQAGDRVMATNGSTSIVYGDGCNVTVAARSMATISAVSPCAGGSSNLVKVSTQGGDRDGGAYGYGSDYDLWLWLTFGIVTVGVVASELNNDESPASP
jgi:hypothetical protein